MNPLQFSILGLSLLAGPGVLPASAQPLEERAAALLEQVAMAYQQVPALSDPVTVTTRRGDAVVEEAFEYTLESDGRRTLRGPRFTAVADGTKLVLAKNSVGRKYLESELDSESGQSRGFVGTLTELLGYQDMPPIPQFEMRTGAGVARYLEALRMGVLGPLQAESLGAAPSARGRELSQLVLVAENGRATLKLRPESHLVVAIEVELTPDPGSGEGLILTASFNPQIRDSPASQDTLELAGRKPVATVAELKASRLERGEPLPQLLLPSLGGPSIPTTALRGAPAVLVFWSENCAACLEDLARAEELVQWVKQEDLAVRVVLVNTLDEFLSPSETQRIVEARIESSGFSQLVLMDLNHELFISIGIETLPSAVAVRPDGSIADYFDGLDGTSIESIKTLLKEPAGP